MTGWDLRLTSIRLISFHRQLLPVLYCWSRSVCYSTTVLHIFNDRHGEPHSLILAISKYVIDSHRNQVHINAYLMPYTSQFLLITNFNMKS